MRDTGRCGLGHASPSLNIPVGDSLVALGASFFAPPLESAGGGYPAETVDALWTLAWRGVVANDTFHALRAFIRSRAAARRRPHRVPTTTFRSRRMAPPSAEGRWTIVPAPAERPARNPALRSGG